MVAGAAFFVSLTVRGWMMGQWNDGDRAPLLMLSRGGGPLGD